MIVIYDICYIYFNTNNRNIYTLYMWILRRRLINMGMWRNGSALDSKSKGCEFKSRRSHLLVLWSNGYDCGL